MKKIKNTIFRTKIRASIAVLSVVLVGVGALLFTQAAAQDNVKFVVFCSTDSCAASESDLAPPADYIPKWYQREVSRPFNVDPGVIKITGASSAATYRSGSNADPIFNVLENVRNELNSRFSPTTKVSVLLGFSAKAPDNECGLGYVGGNFSVFDFVVGSCRRSYYNGLAHELGHNFGLNHTDNGTLMDGDGGTARGADTSNLDSDHLDAGQAQTLRSSSEWFVAGAPPPPPPPSYQAPKGNFDGISCDVNNQFNGWAFDPDTSASIQVHIYVNAPAGASGAVGPSGSIANKPSGGQNSPPNDVNGAYGISGNHRFSIPFSGLTQAQRDALNVAGTHSVYVYPIGYDANGNEDDKGNGVLADNSPKYYNPAGCSSSDTTPPSAPAAPRLNGSATSSSIPLTWNANPSGDGVTSYELTISGGTSRVTNVGNTTSYNVTGLSPSSSYNFSVKAKDAAGNSSPSSASFTTSTAASTPAGNYFTIVGAQVPNKCLDVYGASNDDQAKIELYRCVDGAPNQLWTLMPDKSIRGKGSGKCLDAVNYQTSNGTIVQQYTCANPVTSNQQWVIGASDNSICVANTRQCLDARGPSNDDNTQIHLWEYFGQNNQKWTYGGSTTTTPPPPPPFSQATVVTACSGTNSVANVSWGKDTGGGQYYILMGYGAHGHGGWANYNISNGTTSIQIPNSAAGSGSSLTYNKNDYWALLNYNRTGQEFYTDFTAKDCSATPPPADSVAPSVPGNFTLNENYSSVTVGWTASTDNVGVSGYQIYRNGSLLRQQSNTGYTDTAVSPKTPYSYYVRAYDAANNGANTATKSITTDPSPDTTPPSKPGKPVIDRATPSSISFSWPANPSSDGVVKYRLYRNGSFFTDATGNSYTDSGLPQNTTYSYTVTAWDGANNQSAASDATSATTTTSSDTQAPTIPSTPVRATNITASSASLAWDAASDNVGVTSYLVYNGSTVIASVGGTSMNVSGLNSNQGYTFTVRARDAAGNTSPSYASVTVKTLQPPDTQKPSTPANLRVTSYDWTYNTYNLAFSLSSDNVGVTGYRRYIRVANTGSYYIDGTYPGNSSWTPGRDATVGLGGLDPSKTYEFYLTAIDGAGNESPTTQVLRLAPPPDTTPPSAPSNVYVSSRHTSSLNLVWDLSSDTESGVSRYRIYRNNSQVGETTNTYWNDTGLARNTTYTYKVQAFDKSNNGSAQSSQISGKTCLAVDSPCL